MEDLNLTIIDRDLTETESFYKFASDWMGLINAHKKEEPEKKEPWTTIDLRPIKEKWHELPMGHLSIPIEFEGVPEATFNFEMDKISDEFPYTGDKLALYLEIGQPIGDDNPLTFNFKGEYVEL